MENKTQLASSDFIFIQKKDGSLVFKGNFEGLYQNDDMPWGQSGNDERLNMYYKVSRETIVEVVSKRYVKGTLLEVGCGLGFVCNMLHESLPGIRISGMDISKTAISKAKKLFPDIKFYEGDICDKNINIINSYDIVLMNEVLWYILKKIDCAFENLKSFVSNKGILIISNGYLPEQRYGKNIINGFNGLINYLANNHFNDMQFLEAFYNDNENLTFFNGVAVMRKV